MIKILYFTVDSMIGGTEKMVLSLAAALPKDRFSVTILTIKPNGLLHRWAREAGIPAYNLGVMSRTGAFLVPFRLYHFLLANRPDVLHTFLFSANVVGRLVGWAANVPLVIGSQRSTDLWRQTYHNVLDLVTFPLSRLIVSNSEAGRRMLLQKCRFSADKVKVIPNGVPDPRPIDHDEAKAMMGFAEDDLLLGAVGNLRLPKGYQYLLPAFRELRQKNPKAQLLIAGVGSMQKELELFSRRLGLAGSVHFVGFLKDLHVFYSALDIFVLPSLWEGMPVAILEAMSYGVPVISTNVSGIPEVITDGQEGFLVDPANPQEIAQKLLSLSEDKVGRLTMGQRGKDLIALNFSRQRMVDAYGRLYTELMKTV